MGTGTASWTIWWTSASCRRRPRRTARGLSSCSAASSRPTSKAGAASRALWATGGTLPRPCGTRRCRRSCGTSARRPCPSPFRCRPTCRRSAARCCCSKALRCAATRATRWSWPPTRTWHAGWCAPPGTRRGGRRPCCGGTPPAAGPPPPAQGTRG
ncbi:hypothetical protein BU14_0521s0009 [Porphyra umbilicalis]|uniref:Uncharacterized protein n=1 Tax=Porphyra umbilicalis TaxID=2786 RepID=A0A1X6NSV2_PORUM|nr:hypothetical protein BU14_0521s0009 [Porphyra umbilicalis]|eukprot:OSX71576.1 hypothetical protein BU14_0521s0009 [Porphyra umbilicalis]